MRKTTKHGENKPSKNLWQTSKKKIKKRQRVTVREITIVQYRPRRLEDQTPSLSWPKNYKKFGGPEDRGGW